MPRDPTHARRTLLGTACAMALGGTLHVAPDGDDGGPGSAARPLATIAAAVTRAAPGAEIVVHAGTYRVAEPIVIDGTLPGLVVRAEGVVRLHGGFDVPGEAWGAVDADLAGRLPPEARQSARQVDLAGLGIDRIAPLQPRGFGREGSLAPVELFVGGAAQTLARWPDEGFVTTGEVVEDGAGGARPTFAFDDPRAARWLAEDDVWAYGYWCWDWADESLPVASIAAGRVQLGEPHRYPVKAGRPFWIENVLAELDRPGEYWIDRAGLRLVAWLPSDAPARLSLSDRPLLRLDGAERVAIEGLTFETARAWAVELSRAREGVVERCLFRDLGLGGVRVDGGEGCTVRSSRFVDLGEGGITLAGGDRATLAPAGHVVEDCVFERYSRRARTYRPGVKVAGVGMTVRRSTFRDAPHCAILFSGNDHRFEGNHVARVLASTGDGGAVYGGRDWTARGTVIRGNLFEGLHGEHKYENGVYLDDQLSGTTVEGNVFVDCWWGMLVGGGRDNVVRGNLFFDCHLAVHGDARGLGWAARMRGTLEERLEAVPYASPVWRERYPELARLLGEEPMAPRGNVVEGNLLVRSGTIDDDLAPAFREGARIEGNAVGGPDLRPVVREGRVALEGGGLERLPADLASRLSGRFGPTTPVPEDG
jgi:parallel beta-helix repeat protein